MDLLQDLVVSEIRLPSTVFNRLATFNQHLWSGQELDPLTCALNGWELDAKDTLVCRECHAKYIPSPAHNDLMNAHHKKCYNNLYTEFIFPDLDSASVLSCFTNRAKGLLKCKIRNSIVVSDEIDLSLIRCDFSDDIKLLSLFGWEWKTSDSITCHLCNRTLGLWKENINVKSDHRWWCPWVKESSKIGWEITFYKLTSTSYKPVIHLDDASQVVDWLNTIMPTNRL